MIKSDARTVVIVADTHFKLVPDAAGRSRLERFVAFLDAAHDAEELVLLGDIFDFWFDYPHFRLRGYEEILQALDRLHAAGVRLHFVGGNHDIWAAGYFHERYGTRPDGDPITLAVQGRRLRLVHGDGLLAKDYVYNSFRWLVRQRAGVLIAKAFHPELLFAFSTWLSHTSRNASRDEADQIVARARHWLARAEGDWDLFLIGHVHHPFKHREGDREFAALGSWFGTESYAVLKDGVLELRDFREAPPV